MMKLNEQGARIAIASINLVQEMAKEPCAYSHGLRGKTCVDCIGRRGACHPCRARMALKESEPRDLNFGRPADPARVEP